MPTTWETQHPLDRVIVVRDHVNFDYNMVQRVVTITSVQSWHSSPEGHTECVFNGPAIRYPFEAVEGKIVLGPPLAGQKEQICRVKEVINVLFPRE